MHTKQSSTPILVVPGRSFMDADGQRLRYRRDAVIVNDREIGFIQSTSDSLGSIVSTSHCGHMVVYGANPEWVALMSEMLESYDIEDADKTNIFSRELTCHE